MRHARTIAAVALLAATVPAAAARADGPSANPPGMKRLSDERTLSRWAYPNNHARVRSRPTGAARTVTKPALADRGQPARDLPRARLLARRPRQHLGQDPRPQAPQRRHGLGAAARPAPVQPGAHVPRPQPLDAAHHALPLGQEGHVDARRHRLEREPDAARALLHPREVPRLGRPGLRPLCVGHERLRPAPDRLARGRRRRPARHQRAGPIPGRPSHGCIRLRNEKIARLYRLTPRGTPIHIHD